MMRAVAWRLRDVPLEPSVVVAEGEVAVRLAAHLRAGTTDVSSLSGVFSPRLLLVSGPADRLPWVDGVHYLGRDPRAPSLRLSTTHTPDVAPELFEAAIVARLPNAPVCVIPGESLRILSLSSAGPVDRDVLERAFPSVVPA